MSGQDVIYVLSQGGQQSAYKVAQVRQMMTDQILTPETYFWREGMADWRPLSELQPPLEPVPDFVPPKRTAGSGSIVSISSASTHSPVAAPVTSQPAPSRAENADPPPFEKISRPVRRYEFETNPIPLTIVLQIFIVLSLGVTPFFVFKCISKIEGWTGLSHADAAFLNRFFFGLFGFHLVIDILFFVWVYYTNKNCRGFVSNMTYTPGWAVGYFFIPILNLFRPYQVIQEIWKVSRDPLYWNGTRDSIFVGLWFAIRLMEYILARGQFHTSFSDSTKAADLELGHLTYLATLESQVMLMEFTTFVLISIITWRHVQLVRGNRSD